MSFSIVKQPSRIRRVWDAWWYGVSPPEGRLVHPDPSLDSLVNLLADKLTFTKLAALISSAMDTALDDGLELFEEIESKDPRVKAVANTRRNSLTGLAWEVVSAADVLEDVPDKALADEAATFVRGQLTGIEYFDEALEHLATGIGPNLALLENVWERSRIVDFQVVYSDRIIGDPRCPGVIRVLTSDDSSMGVIAAPPKFVVHMPHGFDLHPFRKSLARPQAKIYLMKALAIADWKLFLEIFGMPIRIGKYDPNTSQDEKTTLTDMLRNLGANAWGAFSRNVDLELIESSQRGTAPYEAFVNYLDRETAILWLGGNLITDTTGGTGSFAAGSVQDEIKDDLNQDDIKRESRTVGRQIISPMCAYQFRRVVPLPVFRRVPPLKDRAATAVLIKDAQAGGVDVPRDWAYNVLGIPKPEPGEAILAPPDPFAGGVEEGFSGA